MATVSLIVPTCGESEWYDECLASIRAQTHKDIQLIVEEDPKRTGAAATRNRGLAKATGEFVAFCDDDDYLLPDAIERLVAGMTGVDMVCGSFRKFGNWEQLISHPTAVLQRSEVAKYVLGNLQNPRINQMLSGCWAKMYRRQVVVPFPEWTTAEDMAFNFSYLFKLNCKRVRFVEDVVYHNRKHSKSLSTTFDPANRAGLMEFSRGLKYVEKFLASFYSPDAIDDAIDNSKAYHAALYFMRICQYTGKPMNEAFLEVYP